MKPEIIEQTYEKNEKHDMRETALQQVHLRSARAKLDVIARKLSTALGALGFTVHRCDSVGTASIYLCIDYGLCGTVRISDHPGKKHLNFRYNIILGQTERKTVRQGERKLFYYPPEDVDGCVSDIAMGLGDHMARLSASGYLAELERMKRECAGKPGFWQRAEQVEKEAEE